MDTPIVASTETEHKPQIRHFRITPQIHHAGRDFAIADGVVEVEGCAYLGQVRGAGPAFTVAAFVNAAGECRVAPVGWQADIQAASSLNPAEGGDEPPPSPAWVWVVARRGAVQVPHCPSCGFVLAWGGATVRCLAPHCTYERAVDDADRQRLLADVVIAPAPQERQAA